MNSFRIKDLRFRILKGGKIGLCASLMMFGMASSTLNATVTIDGNGSGGYIVNGSTTIGDNSTDRVYTNFYTQGGAGSGGGAGLGGVFFVNENAALSLNNVSFSSNAIKGGQGGNAAQALVGDITLALQEKSSSVGSLQEFQITPTLVYNAGTYTISGVKLSHDNTSFVEGSTISLSGGGLGTIGTITDDVVTFDSAITIDSASKTSAAVVGGTSSGASITTINVSDIAGLSTTNIKEGAVIYANGVQQTISSVSRDLSGTPTSFTLSGAVNTTSGFDIINIQNATASKYEITSSNTITLNASGYNLVKGMTLTGNGIPNGTTITDIVGNTVTLSQNIASNALSFEASLPIGSIGSNQLNLPSTDARLAVGMPISGIGIPNGTTITAISSTGVVTLSQNLTAVPDQIVTDTVISSGSGNVTLSSTSGLKTGMVLTIDGVPTGTITGINPTTKQVTYTALTGTYGVGGNMNANATVYGTSNGILTSGNASDGGNGTSGRPGYAFLNEGEGQDGTNGHQADSAEDGVIGVGGNGGNGGSGSAGIGFNYQLAKGIIDTTADVAFEYAEATSNFGNLPFPDGAEATAHFANAILKLVNLGELVANQVIWTQDLYNGLVARGGAGGDGGAGGNGSDFFGGGAGGAGGAGGEGAYDFTDGGDGGSGGSGGDGGFGAGGGSGGAAGDAGKTGAGTDGDEGDGGVAGFGAGNGSNGDGLYGNGGSGFGGAIFVRTGGSLTISGNSTFENNYALAGSSNNRGTAGEAAGTDMYIMKGSDVLLSPGYGKTIRIEGTIADDSQATFGDASYAAGDGANLRIGAGGLVQLLGENTYSGNTQIEGATLQADIGTGINDDSHIVFAGTGDLTTSTSDNSITAHNNAGVLLTSGEITRRVDIWSNAISWEGAGGFAASSSDGLLLNFGAITSNVGQVLKWNTAALTNDSVMVFGSEYGLGGVTMLNDININNSTANIAVFDSTLTNSDYARLDGKLTNGNLQVGDVGYDGILYLTGDNDLTNIKINSGTTSTGFTKDNVTDIGNISSSSNHTNVSVHNDGELILADNETLGTVNIVDVTSILKTYGDISVDTITNNGTLMTFGEATTSTITNTGALSIFGGATVTNIVNNATLNAFSDITTTTTTAPAVLNNTNATWNQAGDLTADTVSNLGTWNVFAEIDDDIRVINTDKLTGTGTFNLITSTITPESGPSVDVTGNLKINQSGTSTFGGSIAGAGKVEKTGNGALSISSAQTFTGGLDITGGTFETLSGGTLANNLDVHVFKDSTFIAGAVDTVGSVLVDNNTGGTNAGLFTMNANITTQGDFTNNGTLALNANLTTGDANTNNGTTNDFINNGTTTLTADRIITTEGGLSGATTGVINVNNSGTTLTLAQSGDTTYSGKIQGAGNFVKDGNGNLTLNGTAGNIDLDEGTVVNDGTLTTELANVFAADQDITVNTDGTLHIKTGSQSVDTITNSGIVNLDDDLTVRVLTNNASGTFNQEADIISTNAIMNGNWNVEGEGDVNYTRVLNTTTLIGDATVTLKDYVSGLTTTASHLKINQSGNSRFDGSIGGTGSVEKTGTGILQISDAQTFTGGLNVTGGTFQTVAGISTFGTLADTNAIHVYKDSTFIAGVEDTVGSVLVDAIGSGAAAGLFTMNANITTQGDFTNNGTLALNANLTTLNTDISTDTDGDFINNGTTTLTDDRTITTAGGLSGATTGVINVNNSGTTLTLAQSGDTTYSGKIQGAGNFVKDGNGNLTLNGTAGNIDLDEGTVVNDGTLTTELANVFAADQDITVNTDGTLHIKTGSQSVDTITNSGIVNLDDDLTVRILTNNILATFNQEADITSIDAIMNGIWNVTGKDATDTRVLNTTTLSGDATVTLKDYLNGSTTTASNLKINQSGNSTFDGSIAGAGSIEKTGNGTLKISDVQTFTGGLDVTGGTFETLADSRLADSLAINVKQNSTFIAGAVDTVGSVLVDANGTFTLGANTTTQTSFKNDGTLALNANLTTGTDFENNGTTTLAGNRVVTTTGGLKGDGDIVITNIDVNNPTGLTLAQSGNTTYSGTIKGTGNFTKEGTGTLTLSGVAGSVNLNTDNLGNSGLLTINGGILALDGDYILADTLDVLINNNGTMQLIDGDQEIDELMGTGLIDLGTDNTLVVNQGGNFSGRVIGTGTLDIVNGDFDIDDDITSDNKDSAFNVGSGATTTITDTSTLTFPTVDVQGTLNVNGTTQATTVTVQGTGAELNVNGTVNTSTVTVQGTGSELNVGGTVNASNSVIVYDGATLHLNNGGNIETDIASIYGVLNGIGSISGDTTVYSGGTLRPGNSPGTITFDSLTLLGGSVVDMEINDSGVAGVNFDQIISQGALNIASGATLNIIKYDGGALPVAEELSMGETIKVFNFTPGAVSGKFDSVTSTYDNDVLFNIASGEVVGLGGLSSTQFQKSIAKTSNQKSMLDDLNIENNGGVSQFYGGYLVSRLAAAYGDTNETNKIFDLASPEAYTGLIDQARLSLTDSLVTLPINHKEVKEGLTAHANHSTRTTSNSSDWAEYEMSNNSYKLEYTHVHNSTVLAVSLGQNQRKVNSDYMSADGSGNDFSLGLSQELIPGLSVRGFAGYMKDDNDLERQTFTRASTADNVGSDGWITGLGLGYSKDLNSLTFDFAVDASYYNANVDSFEENNRNALDGLSVDKQEQEGMAYQAKAVVSSKITDKLKVQTGLNVLYMPEADKADIKAKVIEEKTWFNVENPGIGETMVGLNAGAQYEISKNMHIEVDGGLNQVDKSDSGYNTNLSFTYKF